MRMKSAWLMMVAASVFCGSFSVAAPALDAQGKCRDGGKFVAASLCQKPTAAATKCRDVKTKKFAKCGTPNTEPVPVSSAK